MKQKLKIQLIIFLIIAIIVIPLSEFKLKNGEPYKAALEYFQTDSEFTSQYGEYIKVGFFVSGNIRRYIEDEVHKGEARLSFDVTTDKGKFDATVYMLKEDGKWIVSSCEVRN